MARVLVVDDEAPLRRLIKGLLSESRHQVAEADCIAAAIEAMNQETFDVILTDQKMSGGTGTDLISHCKKNDSSLPVVMITAYASVELAVEAMRAGAFDFISKPFEPEVVRSCVVRAAEQARLRRDNRRLRGEIDRLITNDLVGDSPSMVELKSQLQKVAPTKATILVHGETGTGKEVIARAIHQASPRAAYPFIAVNCAALAETLLESELFGHERGAFTGADRTRAGVFESADGGTLFLDEAGDMHPTLQAKLLRVLMDGSFSRVGSTQERRADVRVIAATHRKLRESVNEGRFREDLYYRLAVVTLTVPPLRERAEDIAAISDALLVRISRDLGISAKRLAPEALSALEQYSFPGNVRELRNILERGAILSSGEEIALDDLPPLGGSSEKIPVGSPKQIAKALLSTTLPDGGLRSALEEIERSVISIALQQAGGVQAEAARQLGMTKSDFFYRIQKYKIQGE